MIKIRIGSEKQLHKFETQTDAFNWIKADYSSVARYQESPFIFSVLSYEQGVLEAMDRFYFNGEKFSKENILS
jgi:hypothetical protein